MLDRSGFVGAMMAASALVLAAPSVLYGQSDGMNRPSLQDSFRIGGGGGAICQAQNTASDPAVRNMFDRAWTIVCRDSAEPVGQLFALRGLNNVNAAMPLLTASRKSTVTCSDEGGKNLPGVGAVLVRNCRLDRNGIGYSIVHVKSGKFTYVAQGFAAYESALDLALRTVVTDAPAPGQVEVANLGNFDSGAFARMQAKALDPQTVLAEGYRRNNSGNYAEAAEFFDSLEDRLAENDDGSKLDPAERTNRLHEYVINRALQRSNLGEFAQADTLFAQAENIPTVDRVQLHLRRNFEAMNALNQKDYARALEILQRPMPSLSDLGAGDAGAVELTPAVAAEISSGLSSAQALGIRQATKLTPRERVAIIDAQAQQLRGTILRLTGKPDEARSILTQALSDAVAIRDGRVTSITRLRSQLLAEIGATYEAQDQFGAAEDYLNQSVEILRLQYPETVALNGARARLAAYLVRRARDEDAIALYRKIIQSTAENNASLTGIANQLQPYFDVLASGIPLHPEYAQDLFLASQTLVRPGAADTLEVLTRELSSGSDEGARLFRQSVSLSRDIERGRIELAQLNQALAKNPSVAPMIAAQQKDIEQLSAQQTDTLARLGGYPQFRAVSREVIGLSDLQSALKPGEAYIKMAVLGEGAYVVYADANGATGYKLPISPAMLSSKVDTLRETISTYVNGAQATYPLDVKLAREMFIDLLGPVSGQLADVKSIIFEPDGAMLSLPPALLIASQPGVDAYMARITQPGSDEFDFRGIDWLGRTHAMSTSLSARAFRDARMAAPSKARKNYIGFGENAPVNAIRQVAFTRSAVADQQANRIDCDWPLAQWSQPIPATELREAAALLRGGTQVVTGAAFTDDSILARDDLSDFRILHFATHGLVTAPRRGCPARPALVTSFGPAGKSDGLLQFGEIFDMKLDADLVILSACDTAGKASREATQAAGLTTGGGSALDGLVRAFIGAGGRSVIASHWPAPEEFQATEKLISGLFRAPPGEGVAEALHDAALPLMDSAETSHPFYWAGFAVIGDGSRPLVSAD